MKNPVQPLKAAEEMLMALVKEAAHGIGRLSEPGAGTDAWYLASAAHVIDADEEEERRQFFVSGLEGDPVLWYGQLMCDEGWAAAITVPNEIPQYVPTALGLEVARRLTRPWYRKAWEYLKGDVRTVVIAVVTAMLTTWLPSLVG